MTHSQIIDALGGTGAVARALEVADSRVSMWKNRGIAWRYRPRIAEMAKRRRIKLPTEFLA